MNPILKTFKKRKSGNVFPNLRGLVVIFFMVQILQSASLKLDDYASYQVVQRHIGETSGTVTISGKTDVQSCDAVEAAVLRHPTHEVVVPWTKVDSGISQGAFSGSLNVPQGGWYVAAARAMQGKTVVCGDTGTHNWGIGFNILCIGQSNMAGNGDETPAKGTGYTPVTSGLAGLYSNDNRWIRCQDPYDDGGLASEIDYDADWVGASMVPAMVNSLSKKYPGIPIGVVPAAKGATPLHCMSGKTGCLERPCWAYRNSSNPADPNTLYGNSLANARAASGVEFVVMHQGETDAQQSCGTTREQYITDIGTLGRWYRQDLGITSPLIICQIARSLYSGRDRYDENISAIRAAQLLADGNDAVMTGALCIDLPIMNHDHYYRAAYDVTGKRIAQAIAFCNGDAAFYRGPSIGQVLYFGKLKDKVIVRLTHRGGNNITPASGITGFEVLDGHTPVPQLAAMRLDESSVLLTLARPVSGAGLVRYLYGRSPDISGAVKDNSPLALPLEPTAAALAITEPGTGIRIAPLLNEAETASAINGGIVRFDLLGRQIGEIDEVIECPAARFFAPGP